MLCKSFSTGVTKKHLPSKNALRIEGLIAYFSSINKVSKVKEQKRNLSPVGSSRCTCTHALLKELGRAAVPDILQNQPQIFCGPSLAQILLSPCGIPDPLDDAEIRALWGPRHHFLNSVFFWMALALHLGSLSHCRTHVESIRCLPNSYFTACLHGCLKLLHSVATVKTKISVNVQTSRQETFIDVSCGNFCSFVPFSAGNCWGLLWIVAKHATKSYVTGL